MNTRTWWHLERLQASEVIEYKMAFVRRLADYVNSIWIVFYCLLRSGI